MFCMYGLAGYADARSGSFGQARIGMAAQGHVGYGRLGTLCSGKVAGGLVWQDWRCMDWHRAASSGKDRQVANGEDGSGLEHHGEAGHERLGSYGSDLTW